MVLGMDDGTAVPFWCEFFSAAEYEAFCEAVDEAAGLYGGDGRDLSRGTLVMVAGEPLEMCGFDLGHLADRCREHPRGEWEGICRRQVMDWVEGGTQRAWLTAAPFGEVADLLTIRLTGEREVVFQGDPDGPDQPFSVQVADNLHASLVALAPELEGAPEIQVHVPNSAAQAWGRTAEELLATARGNLRRLPPPTWEPRTCSIVDDDGEIVATVDVYFAAPPDVDPPVPVSSWLLILDAVAPVTVEPWAMAAVPTRDSLLLSPLSPDDDDLRGDQITAVYHYAGTLHDDASAEERVSPQQYIHRPPGEIVSTREYSPADAD